MVSCWFAVWELLQLLEIPSWGASLILSGLTLIAFVLCLLGAKRAFTPKPQKRMERVTGNDLLLAFLDGLMSDDK